MSAENQAAYLENIGKALDIIQYDPDWKKLVFEIIKHNPAAVVQAYYEMSGWKQESRRLIRMGEYVNAIKSCRSDTGWGLREAKDACDKLREEMARAGEINYQIPEEA